MLMYVIVLPQEETKPINMWQVAVDHRRQLYTVDERGRRISSKDAWENLAIDINETAHGKKHTALDVILYVSDSLPLWLNNLSLLDAATQEARDHSWGGNVYIAWDRVSFNILWNENGVVFERWFKNLIDAGVTDLIEVTKEKTSPEGGNIFESMHKALCDRALKAKRRREVLREFVIEGGWGAIVRTGIGPLERFITMLVNEKLLPSGVKNHAVFFDAEPYLGFIELMDKLNDINQRGSRFAAALPFGKSKYDRLEYYCNREKPILKIIDFNGAFEYLYALIQLNRAGQIFMPRQATSDAQDRVEFVEPSKEMQLKSEPQKEPLRLLVTSAFHPTDPSEAKLCLSATKEIGALLRDLPFHIDVEVHPWITCELLPNLLDGGRFTAWLHISHGDRAKGLYEARTGEFASPDRWLTCFKIYKESLQLVLISACESAEIAKLFAAAGVRVAIGFEKKILPEATRIMTKKVIQEALQTGDRRYAIIAAFQDACQNLSSHTYLDDEGNKRNYIDAEPKAFIAR